MSLIQSQTNRNDLDKQIAQISENELALTEIEVKVLCEKVTFKQSSNFLIKRRRKF
jgi:hypothetical protein